MSPAAMRHLAMAYGSVGRQVLMDGDKATGSIMLAMKDAHDLAAFTMEEERQKEQDRFNSLRELGKTKPYNGTLAQDR